MRTERVFRRGRHLPDRGGRGDEAAFEKLVRRRQGMIRGLMRQLSGDIATADDLSQEAFILAWRRLSSLRKPGAFGGWLRRIAVNVFLQHVRRKRLSEDDFHDPADHPAPSSGNPVAQMDLEQALTRLRPVERLCVVLACGQGMSHAEVSAATDLPLGTVKSHIARGGARLRELLAAYERNVR